MKARRTIVAAALALGGCATLDRALDAHLASPDVGVRECAQWYRDLDGEIDAAGVRDVQYARVPGFAYLRVDRALAAQRKRAAASEAALHALSERMLQLDLAARAHEIRNLPQARPGALVRTRDCGRLLRELDLARPEARAAMLEAARVRDDYSEVRRILGVYGLSRLAFASGVRRWEGEALAAFSGPSASNASLARYSPPASAGMPRGVVAAILARARLDPLGEPRLTADELGRLAAAYAPSFEIAPAGDFDRFGRLRWGREGETPEVDGSEPTVYVQHALTRYGEATLLQLVYTIWFSERPPREEGDILAGRLDGLVWRVTLAPDGAPLVFDSIHPCGCYHMFFPTPRARPRPPPDALEEWVFVPQTLPAVAEDEHPVLRIASGTHYIERVTLDRGAEGAVRYAFRPYDELRSLSRADGGTRSAFGPDGLIAGSERAERFLFWPMGILSPGAMRQWGRHATAFIGRRHFDDSDLIERRFELDAGDRPRGRP